MKGQEIQEAMYASALIPVVAIEDSADAVALGQAFLAAGVKVAEITFRTAAAADSIRALAESGLDILVGAGTVLTVEMAQQAVEAGAKFLVTPGFDENVVAWAVDHQVPIYPGITSPSEIAQAQRFGLTVLKFFPSESAGGTGMLKSLAGPYGSLRFIPTGGISEKNIGAYMDLPNVLACGGSWICPTKLIREKRFDEITALTRQAVQTIHDFFLLHVGINCSDGAAAAETAQAYGALLGQPVRDGVSLFVGDMLEINKQPGRGHHGHLAISVRNIDRAMAYFRQQGYRLVEGSISRDEKGIIAVYFEQEIGGFAIHLRRHL